LNGKNKKINEKNKKKKYYFGFFFLVQEEVYAYQDKV